MRRSVREAAVAAQALIAEVIGHDENDVWLLSLELFLKGKRRKSQRQRSPSGCL